MNKNQIKAGFKKEWLQFFRTFRFGGLILAILSFAIADPLMYKMMAVMMDMLASTDMLAMAASAANDMSAAYNEVLAEVGGLYSDAGLIYSMTNADLCASSVLITMLILMSPSGGEQKKRATIIPAAIGLDYFNYLVPKFVLYPMTVFVLSFLSSGIAGLLCNVMFTENRVSAGILLLGSLSCAVYATFSLTVYQAVGLCTSRPGVAAVTVYFGSTIIQIILTSMELTGFNPFTLRSLATGELVSPDFSLADNAASIGIGILLSVVISVVLFFMTYSVLNAKKINNQEDKPEF